MTESEAIRRAVESMNTPRPVPQDNRPWWKRIKIKPEIKFSANWRKPFKYLGIRVSGDF